MRLKELTIKNYRGLNIKLAFTDKVIVLGGKVGVGKSAIIDAIATLFTGYDKHGKKPSYVFENATDSTRKIVIMGTLDDGTIIARDFQKIGASVKRKTFLNGEETKEDFRFLNTASIYTKEFLELSPDKRAEFVIHMLPEINVFPDNVEKSISGELEELDTKLKKYKQELKNTKGTIKQLSESSDNLPSGSLEEEREKKKKLLEEIEDINSKMANSFDASQIQQKILSAKNAISEKTVELKELEQKISDKKGLTEKFAELAKESVKYPGNIDKAILEVQNEIAINRDKIKEHHTKIAVMKKTNECPVCGGEAGDVIDLYEMQIENWVEANKKKQSALENLLKGKKHQEAIEKLDREVYELDILQTKHKSLRSKLENLNAEITELTANLQRADGANVELLRKQLKGLTETMKQVDANIEAFVSYEAINKKRSAVEDKRIELERKIEDVKAKIKAVKEVRNVALEDGLGKIRALFGDVAKKSFGLEAYLDVVSGSKLKFEFGVVRDENKIPFERLSGGEQSCMSLALSLALHLLNENTAKIGVFELSEADGETLKNIASFCPSLEFDNIFLASCHAKADDIDTLKCQFIDVGEIK